MSIRIIQGDIREELPKLQADSFDCIVTSPPYYGLRDYGTATWEGGDPECDHRQLGHAPGKETPGGRGGSMPMQEIVFKETCGKCGARRIDAQIGLEATLDEYLETMVAVCRELRRVLKPSGVFFLNIGDSYASQGGQGQQRHWDGREKNTETQSFRRTPSGTIKPKDLCLVPERLGIALQQDGWWVRSHIIWAKPNPMPESVTNRPTSAHETIWMLTKSARYFWDGEAVKEVASTFNRQNSNGPSPKRLSLVELRGDKGNLDSDPYGYAARSLRNVWDIPSHPFSGAHFATMPPKIVERCIKAGSSERGSCPACGAPWVRLMSKREGEPPDNTTELQASRIHKKLGCQYTKFMNDNPIKTVGWQPSCKCRFKPGLNPVPSRILDPFAGAGTTGLVADRLGRDATLIDLNTSYTDMAVNRIRGDAPLFAEVAAE